MEWLAELSRLAEITPAGLVVIFVLMIMFGKLVPKPTVDSTVENWKTAYQNERQARQEQTDQINRLTSSLETVDSLLKALRIEAQKSHAEKSD
ncbi:hypothetical protein [Hoyosella altamirensis]|uniref:hypothetical protein n=1 Tax=Hoyosella altamirensis TaxID=616997 RepID=UPI0007DB2988|nr:hypothetical protein [Hoyosella altamirensis]